MDETIDRVWPDPAAGLDDDELLAHMGFPAGRTWLRMNFIASLDGASTREGRSGGLGDAADRRVFNLLRRPADAVLVAAGTARIEGYGAMRLDDGAARWRVQNGLSPHPVFVLVTRSLNLDPRSAIFADAPVRPIVYTVSNGDARRRHALEAVADVVDVGADDVEPTRLKEDLARRGLGRIHSEGGPSLFGSFLAARAVDALHLTLTPTLEGGTAKRITDDERATHTDMKLRTVLRSDSELFLHYVRNDSAEKKGFST